MRTRCVDWKSTSTCPCWTHQRSVQIVARLEAKIGCFRLHVQVTPANHAKLVRGALAVLLEHDFVPGEKRRVKGYGERLAVAQRAPRDGRSSVCSFASVEQVVCRLAKPIANRLFASRVDSTHGDRGTRRCSTRRCAQGGERCVADRCGRRWRRPKRADTSRRDPLAVSTRVAQRAIQCARGMLRAAAVLRVCEVLAPKRGERGVRADSAAQLCRGCVHDALISKGHQLATRNRSRIEPTTSGCALHRRTRV
mmetsp:Transcript_27551/g.82525  ORF Transcript_27551/g.82525 Transcript_27551/m.82525 type:complete len:252 (+) Transcript_27551:476-1231(+)